MTERSGRGLAESHDHQGRRAKARAAVAQRGAAHLLVTDPLNVRYLTGFTGSNGQVLLGPGPGDDLLITDARYDLRAEVEAPDLPRTLDRDPFGVVLPLVVGQAGPGGKLLVEDHQLTWAAARAANDRAAAQGLELVGAGRLVEALRLVKEPSEVARLAVACDITQRCLAWLFDEVVTIGRTERELATLLERRFVDDGADGVAFPSIVASGPNSAIPHHEPTDRRLQAGDLLTIDCGALVGGYHADHTRTVAIGYLDDRLVEVHEVVRAAQSAGRAAVTAGVEAGEVDAAARGVVEDAGYGEAFVHGTGHGVGLAVHEDPPVSRGATGTLRPGIVLTVEPGLYLPGLGGVRIEDTLVVTADGPARALTDTPRELRVL
ncbi:MAG: aminopeptidase P family protein [Nitriliruptor sp.]|nr:MAG: aminopeptidase P family protein [Nitriliruptor sp.]